jgi:hypothetical protein
LFSHVFSTTEEGKAEVFNLFQYVVLALLPVIALNKLVQRLAPEADTDRSSLELGIEILFQLAVLFAGMVIIHRLVTYLPTYSGFQYDHVSLLNIVLAFLVIVLSIQSKLGLKVNILYDRVLDLWSGNESHAKPARSNRRQVQHMPSQADHYDHNPVPPVMLTPQQPQSQQQHQQQQQVVSPVGSLLSMGPVAANALLGGNGAASFGAFF